MRKSLMRLYFIAILLPGVAAAQVLGLDLPPVVSTTADTPLMLAADRFDAPRFDGALAADEALRLTVDAGALSLAPADVIVLDGQAVGGAGVTFAGPGAAAALDGLVIEPPPGFTGRIGLLFELVGPVPRARRLTITVNAPLDAEAARGALLAEVEQMAASDRPGRLVAFGDDAADVGWADGGATAGPRVVAARWGAGRVVALGDRGGLDAPRFADPAGPGSARFVDNAVAWLAGPVDRAPLIVTLDPDLGAWLTDRGHRARVATYATLADELAAADVFAPPRLDPEAPPATAGIISAFALSGGGLLIAGGGSTDPANPLLRPAGLAFADGEPRGADPLAIERAAGRLDADDLFAIAADPSAVADAARARAATVLDDIAGALTPADPLARRLEQTIARAAERISPSPADPVSDPWEKALLRWETRALLAGPPDALPAHRSAALYGEIAANAPPVVRRITIDPAATGWITTGLYAVPGRLVEVEVPPAAFDRGLRLRLGGHTDDITPNPSWHRPPIVHWSAPLDRPAVRLTSPYGGVIYIDAGAGAAARQPVEVVIHGAIEQPVFVLGEDTDPDWRAALTRPAPYAELISPRLVISLPSALARTIDRPTELMRSWDAVIAAQDALAGHADRRIGPARINVDVQALGQAAHPGYPIQGSFAVAPALARIGPPGPLGTWDWLHALGYEALRRPDGSSPADSAYTLEHSVAATAGLFAVHALQATGRTLAPESDWRWTLDPVETMRRALDGLARPGATYATLGPEHQLAMLLELAQGLGWDAIQRTLATYRAGELPVGEQATRDAWLVRLSHASGFDLGRFMGEVWGVEFSAEARATVAPLPDWMPARGGLARTHGVMPGQPLQLDAGGQALSHDGVALLGITRGVAHGVLDGPNDGVFTYRAPADFVGRDAFRYDVISSAGQRMGSEVDITVRRTGVTIDRWHGIPGDTVADLRADPRFPDAPDATEWRDATASPGGYGDDYGLRMRGFLVPPASGRYTLHIASADSAELWLSSDHTPGNLALVSRSAAPGQAEPDPPIAVALEAGQSYHFEALMKHGAGPDALAIIADGPGPDAPAVIDGAHLRGWRPDNAPVVPRDSVATVRPGTTTALSPTATDADGDRWHVISARADRGAAYAAGQSIIYTAAPDEGPARVDYTLGDGRGSTAEGYIAVTVFESLRVQPLAPLGGWVGECPVFRWSPLPGSTATEYRLYVEQAGEVEQIAVRRGGRFPIEVTHCVSERPLTWWVEAFDAAPEPGSLITPGGAARVDTTPPRIDEAQLEVPAEAVCPDRAMTFAWPAAFDDGVGLAAQPYRLRVGTLEYGPTAERRFVIDAPRLGDYWSIAWALEIADAFDNRTEVTGRLWVDCLPPDIASRWSGVLGAETTPDRAFDTGVRPGGAFEVWAGGSLCFTPDRNCDAPLEPTPCATPDGPLPGPEGQPAEPDQPFGALLFADADGALHPALDGPTSTRDVVRLSINSAERSRCRQPGYAVTVLSGTEPGVIWPAEGQVVAEARPMLQARVTSTANNPIAGATLWLDDRAIADGDRLSQGPLRPAEPLAEGRHTLLLELHDIADNIAWTPASSFVVDLSPPADFVIDSPRAGARLAEGPIVACWQTPADVGGIDYYRVTVDGELMAQVGAPRDGRDPCAALVLLGAGERCLRVEAHDFAGRTAAATRCFELAAVPIDMGVEPDMAYEPDMASDMAYEPDMASDMTSDMASDMAFEPDMASDVAYEPDMAFEPDMASDLDAGPPVRLVPDWDPTSGDGDGPDDPTGCRASPGEAPTGPAAALLGLALLGLARRGDRRGRRVRPAR